MTEHGSEAARQYLRELDVALRAVPQDTAREVREGIAEELNVLEERDVRVRIASLGDPVHIAAEARRAAGVEEDVDEVPGEHSAARTRARGSRPFVVTAALLVGFGSWGLPGLGWLAGIVMTWYSPVWRTGEKLVATITPAVIGAAVAITVALAAGASSPSAGESVNPLIPDPALITWNAVIVALVAAMPIGIWLLVTGLRRTRPTTDA